MAESAQQAVLGGSEALPEGTPQVRGYDFPPLGQPVDYERLLAAMATTGFQASAFGAAVAEVRRMLAWRLSDELLPAGEPSPSAEAEAARRQTRCKIFLGYTSNLVSAGVRESIRYLVQHRMVDVIVTTAGGIEEDLIKCMKPTYVGDFHLAGAGLRARGLNRAGNLLIPNVNYCAFEDWVMPILDAMLAEQQSGARSSPWTPSAVVRRLGLEIGHPDSICYWAAVNDIPIYCPALTDGSLGDMLFFHSYRSPGLVIDLVADVRAMNEEAMRVRQPAKTGMLVLGGGVAKHHIANANLMRNGADFCVFVNTAAEFDGCDSGARPDEAVSWGKVRADATPVKLYADATLVFPLLVAQTFATHWQPREK